MKLVRSQGRNDCGICVVATVLGISWEDARERVFGDSRDRRGYITKTKQVFNALQRYVTPGGYWSEKRPLLRAPIIWSGIGAGPAVGGGTVLAIVNVRPQGPKKCGHWVIWDGRKVYCPQSGRAWPPDRCPWSPVSYFRVRV